MRKRKKFPRGTHVLIQRPSGSCGIGGCGGGRRKRSGHWLVDAAIAAAGSVLWVQVGVREGIAFAVVAGVLWRVAEKLRQGPETGTALPKGSFSLMALGCFWVTAASALLAVTILRTIGVPQIEALGGCYIVAAGSAMVGDLLLSELGAMRDRRMGVLR